MKGITIRFGQTSYQLIGQEAAHEGLNRSAFIREAALMRAVVLRCQRGDGFPHIDPELVAVIRRILDQDKR